MKPIAIVLMLIAAIVLFAQSESFSRGGRGGGGGGGGRGGGGGGGRVGGGGGGTRPGGAAARPSPAPGRSPSMSGGARPAARPSGPVGQPGAGAARPGGGNVGPGGGNVAGGGRPTSGQLNNFLDMPSASTGAIGGGARPGAGGAAGDFLQNGGNRPSQLPAGGNVAGRPGVGSGVGAGIGAGVGAGIGAGVGAGIANRGGNFASSRPSRIDNRQQLQNDRQQRRNEVRDQVRDNHPRLDFWADHPNWARWRINAPYRWATWAALGGWFGWGAGYNEITYAYGDNVYYSDDQVYYGDMPVATSDEYANQAATLAASAPQDLNPQNSDWLPLGVFAVTQDRQSTGPDPTLFMQLAVNKDGVMSGTFKNMATGQLQTLEGMVDKKSQRVAWCVQGQSWPIVETGLSSLTQDSFPVLVHFANGETQQWLLVRLEEPKDSTPQK